MIQYFKYCLYLVLILFATALTFLFVVGFPPNFQIGNNPSVSATSELLLTGNSSDPMLDFSSIVLTHNQMLIQSIKDHNGTITKSIEDLIHSHGQILLQTIGIQSKTLNYITDSPLDQLYSRQRDPANLTENIGLQHAENLIKQFIEQSNQHNYNNSTAASVQEITKRQVTTDEILKHMKSMSKESSANSDADSFSDTPQTVSSRIQRKGAHQDEANSKQTDRDFLAQSSNDLMNHLIIQNGMEKLQEPVLSGRDPERGFNISRRAHLMPVSKGDDISFVMVGDIHLAGDVEKRLKELNEDYTYPFEKIRSYLEEIDVKFGSLEVPITNSSVMKKLVKDCSKDPECCNGKCQYKTGYEVLDGIVEYGGFNVLTIENNHIDDFENGRRDTQELLTKFNVTWTDSTHPLKISNFKGCDILFLSYDISNAKNAAYNYKRDSMLTALRIADQRLFKILSVHGGVEYDSEVTTFQKNFAQLGIDNGADVVVFSHAHVPQPVQTYKGKYIFYGLGNFVSDKRGDVEEEKKAHVRDMLIVSFDLRECKEVINMELYNGWINDDYQPEIVSLNNSAISVREFEP